MYNYYNLHLQDLHLVAASRFYTCAQDGLDTVQLALVVDFLLSTSANTPLALMVVITHCNLRWPLAFFLGSLVHLLMCILQLALCGGICSSYIQLRDENGSQNII